MNPQGNPPPGTTSPPSTPPPSIRLLLADDHPVVRAGLRAVLETEPGLTIVAEAATAEEAVERAAAGDIDVVLMDLRFGGGGGTRTTTGTAMGTATGTAMGGAEATAAITARPGAPRVLIVTTYDSDADTLPAIEAGATGYLLKDAPPEELAAAVRTAAAGRTALAPAVAERLLIRLRTPATALTPRETDVLTLVAEGLSNQAVADRLHLTEGTVKSHLARVYTKLDVDSRTAAVATATTLGLIRR
ncbi:response regulator transcription factor [Streptomyces sp. NPDC048290]|uniref:response regulator transcription factor n=1 Tax=Streptomyces sp. NPDC048290 TaxID=3155811 RepID=UPI003418B53E